jgi:hypothetical protein
MENCLSCKWSRDWCCSKKKAKGMITCVHPDLINNNPPLEMYVSSKCNKYEKING